MRIISKRALFEKARKHSDAKSALQVWLETAKAAEWRSLDDIRTVFPSTDMIGKLAIFDIRGNHYRLIVRVEFQAKRIYIKEFLTHAEYDEKRWMKWL
ncbi:MAG TPA: type II toxin-antitoxin system HigB family toxin [Bryobacteraceae bacterium]|nr:type II toxin-antitoxin system HigB family toxin [Bryobacteraceae bacterium]